MIKPVVFEVTEVPSYESISKGGDYVFSITASSLMETDMENAIQAVSKLWDMEKLPAEILLKIDVRLKAVFESLCDCIERDGSIAPNKKPLFAAMKADCQWMLDCLNDLDI